MLIKLCRYFSLFFSFSFLCSFVLARNPEPAFRHFTTEDGLPSSQIYQAFQDVDGYMWFATDKGVVKYNGYEFKTFSTKDGLTDNVVFHLFQDFKKRIWMISLSGSIFIWENNSIHPFKYNSISKKLFRGSYQFEIFVDTAETVFITSSLGVHSITSTGVTTQIVYRTTQLNKERLTIVDRSQNHKPIGIGFVSKPERTHEIYYVSDSIEMIIEKGNLEYGRIRALRRHDKTFLVSIGNSLFELKNKSLLLLSKFSDNVIQLVEDSHENLWICTSKGLIVYCRPGDYANSKEYLSENYISNIIEDTENGYWVTTIDNGIFYLVNHNIANYYNEIENNSPLNLTTDSTNVYVSYFSGSIAKMNSRKMELIKKNSQSTGLNIIFFDNRTSELFVGNSDLHYLKNGKKHTLINVEPRLVNTEFVQNKNALYVGGNGNLIKVENDSVSFTGPFNKRIYCVFSTDDEQLIVGCNDGAYIFNEGEKTLKLLNGKLKDIRINDIKSIHGDLCLATHGKGILLLKEDGTIQTIDESNGLCSSIIHTLCISGNIMWCGSNYGMSKIEFFDQGYKSYKITAVDINNGLISNEIIDINIFKDTVWVASKKGVSFFDSDVDFVNHLSPRVYFTSMKVNSVDTIVSGNYCFPHNRNTISVGFESPLFKSKGKQVYKYMLTNESDSISGTTINREVEFLSLKPGKYSLLIKALNNSGIESAKPAKFQFEILSAWWQRIWFKLSCLLVLFAGSYVLYRRRVSLIEQKYAIDKKQASLQLTAMRAQMNPHFIFNVMDSIRNFIIDNNNMSAEKYLTSFAKLVRYTLEHSDKQECSLEEELQMIRTYIDLEKLRFSDPIDVSYEYDESIDTSDVTIPTMILQPFVENAFKHGMKGQVIRPKLIIKLIQTSGNVKVVIENHGVKKANIRKADDGRNGERNSYGLKLVQERIVAYNKAYSRSINFESEEILNEEGVQVGRRVTVNL